MITFVLTLSALMVISSMYVLIPLINQLSVVFHSPSYLIASVNSAFILCIALGTALNIKDTELQHAKPRTKHIAV